MKIVKKQENLPDTVSELADFITASRAEFNAMRSVINSIKQVSAGVGVRKDALYLAQKKASILLDAESKLGELLALKSSQLPQGNQHKEGNKLPRGITKKQSHYFQQLADNKDIVETVKIEAKENDDLPTRTEVLRKIRTKKQEEVKLNIVEVPLPDGEYNVIYADPPWKYDFAETDNRSIENQYPTMGLEEIKELKVPSAKNAVLFLWATAPKLQQAFEVICSWGFEYKTCSVWDKQKIGMGYWFRGQHELLLVATSGKFSPPEISGRESSVYSEARTTHSTKPEHYYELIEKMFPNGTYLELFSRVPREGWSCWGNQI